MLENGKEQGFVGYSPQQIWLVTRFVEFCWNTFTPIHIGTVHGSWVLQWQSGVAVRGCMIQKA